MALKQNDRNTTQIFEIVTGTSRSYRIKILLYQNGPEDLG